MDKWDLLEEYDLLANLPKDFSNSINAKKWSDRRDALQTLVDVCEKNPRLCPTKNYGELISKLQEIVGKDSNVVCVALAVRSLTVLAKGLRQNFCIYAHQVIRLLLEKFKETKPAVRTAVTDAVDTMFLLCSLRAVDAPIVEVCQKNTNPSVLSNLDLYIYRILLRCEATNGTMDFVRSIGPFVSQHASSGDATVREASYMVVAGVMRLLGEKSTLPLFDSAFADSVKKKKVEEYCKKATIEAAEVKKQNETLAGFGPAGGAGANSTNGSAKDLSDAAPVVAETDVWEMLNPEDVAGKLPNDFHTLVSSKQWKERKEALEVLNALLEKHQRLVPSNEHVKLVELLKTILEKDVHINVAALAAKALSAFAKGLRYDFAANASLVMSSAFQKFKEKKATLRVPVCECVDNIALVAPLSNYIECVETALEAGNPQVRAQTAQFIARLWNQHDSSTLPRDGIKRLAHFLSQRTFDSDAECRDAAYSAIGASMKSIGEEGVKLLFPEVAKDDLKMAKVKEECSSFLEKNGTKASTEIVRLHKAFAAERKPSSATNSLQRKSPSIKNLSKRAPFAARPVPTKSDNLQKPANPPPSSTRAEQRNFLQVKHTTRPSTAPPNTKTGLHNATADPQKANRGATNTDLLHANGSLHVSRANRKDNDGELNSVGASRPRFLAVTKALTAESSFGPRIARVPSHDATFIVNHAGGDKANSTANMRPPSRLHVTARRAPLQPGKTRIPAPLVSR